MNKRYLEIVSTYRNRELYPNPSQFEVLISQSGTKNKKTALDPISLSTPILTFNGSFDVLGATGCVSITSIDTLPSIGAESSPREIIVLVASDELNQDENFYRGAIIELTNNTDIARRRISSYLFLGNDGAEDRAQIEVFDVIPDLYIDSATTAVICNPTDTSLSVNPLLFMPRSLTINSFYDNLIVENVTLIPTETTTIKEYNAPEHAAILEIPQTNPPDLSNWLPTHDYVIRKEASTDSGMILSPPLYPPTTNSMVLSNGLNRDGIYIGDFIRMSSPASELYNEMRRIVSYNGATGFIRTETPFSDIPLVNENYEILQFSRDNAHPFNYTGSLVSQQEVVCYEISLINLVLPNVELQTGSRIAFYPYVYVELNNISSAGAFNNAIYSNNPNAQRMLFRATVSDNTNPTVSAFVKLNGDGMVQTVKFKPNDSFRFGVYISTGEPFLPDESDNLSPQEPNNLLQLSAMFSMRRL